MNFMNILAMDTSTKYLSLAMAEDGKILASFHRDMEQRQCERLIPEIDKLLKKAKLKLKDIGCVAFSKGPGSFTALRIGAATVKGLAFAANPALSRKGGAGIKIVGVPTLDVLAQGISNGDTLPKVGCPQILIVPIVDARRGNVYASVYSFKNGKLRRHMKYSVLPIAELLKSVKSDTIFLGDGLIAYGQYIKDNFKHKSEFAPEKDWYPRAATVAHMGYELIKKKKFEDTDKFVPMYLYPRDVQVRGKRI